MIRRHVSRDRLLSRELSYRGTLLGMRHGLDLVTITRDVALVVGEAEVADWCVAWLATRKPLVERAAELMRFEPLLEGVARELCAS